MCGIFGYIPKEPVEFRQADTIAQSLFTALKERGPDDRGYAAYSAQGQLLGTEKGPISSSAGQDAKAQLLLGQTRLSIIDTSSAGHQPMHSACGRYTLVYNGEVYNYLELKVELQKLGASFHTATDSEVLLQALIHWGKACLNRLTGMFAFAFYDNVEKTVFCARDFFGIKPFYWTRQQNVGFAFASELPALLCFPHVKRKLNWLQAYNFFIIARVGVGAECLIENVFQLEPAHYMLIHSETGEVLHKERYWQVPLPSPQKISFDEAAEEARRLFLQSVRLHLRSDVPLGVALSGGIDSSAVACAVRHLEPDMPLHTFTYVAKDSEDISEEKWADAVIAHTQATAHKVFVSQSELQNDIDRLILRLGEPFISTSIYAQYRVFQLVKERDIVVTLDGQGADEMLAGYFGYPEYRLQTLVHKGQFVQALQLLRTNNTWPGRDYTFVLQRFIGLHTPDCLQRIARKIVDKPLVPSWLREDNLREHKALQLLRSQLSIYNSRDKVRKALATQLTWDGLPNLLRHGDRNAMSFSVESRVPFCTKELAEFFLSLPEHYLIDNAGWTKSVFRKAMRGIVPDTLLDRRDKIGFATPEKLWLEQMPAWVEESLDLAKNSQLLHHKNLLKEWKDICNGKRPFHWYIWRCINYLRWKELLRIEE